MYEAQLAADWTYILNDSGAHVVLTANDGILATVKREVLPNTPGVQTALSLDAEQGQEHGFPTAMARHATNSSSSSSSSTPIHAPSPDDLANLIYTSGTTGKPKVRTYVVVLHRSNLPCVMVPSLCTMRIIIIIVSALLTHLPAYVHTGRRINPRQLYHQPQGGRADDGRQSPRFYSPKRL